MDAGAPNLRFRKARERLGLSPEEFAKRGGILPADVSEIEELDYILTACYSPRRLQRFCQVLGIHPVELFGDEVTEPAVGVEELVRLTREACRWRGVTLERFEELVGWRLSSCIEPPEKLLGEMEVAGLQCLCRVLRIDWRRVLLSL